jgi:hypothetical protein
MQQQEPFQQLFMGITKGFNVKFGNCAVIGYRGDVV